MGSELNWDAVREVRIASVVRRMIEAGTKLDPVPPWLAGLAKVLHQRETDDRFKIRVRHIGSVEDPCAADALDAAEKALDHAAAVRARKALRDCGEEVTDVAVTRLLDADPEYRRERGRHFVNVLRAGLGDEEEVKRIVSLGAEVLLHAAREVMRWQNIDAALGEG